MKSMMSLDGAPADIDCEVAAECDGSSISRIRAMVAASLKSKGLTYEQVGFVIGVSRQQATAICQSVPGWQLKRSREIIDGAVGELLD